MYGSDGPGGGSGGPGGGSTASSTTASSTTALCPFQAPLPPWGGDSFPSAVERREPIKPLEGALVGQAHREYHLDSATI